MARLNTLLIRKSPHFLNTVKERVLDLRGKKIAFIENLDATDDQFDTIDLSDNDIVKLENFPVMNRLGSLLIDNNKITSIIPNLGEFLPKMHTLGLMHNRLTRLADIDPLASLPKLQFLSLLDNTITQHPDYRLYVINKLKHLQSLDYEKVKQQEKVESAQKFDCKAPKAYMPVQEGDAQNTTKVLQQVYAQDDQANQVAPKAYIPVQEIDAQNTTKVLQEVYAQDATEEQCPQGVATPPQITTCKAAIVNSQIFVKVTNPEMVPAEFAIPNPDATNKVEASEETYKMKMYGQEEKDGADEQKQHEESTPIQEAAIVNSQTVDKAPRLEKALSTDQILVEFVIPKPDATTAASEEMNQETGVDVVKQNEESTLIQEEMLGADFNSPSIAQQGQFESYAYNNFQQTLYKVMSSWRKKSFHDIHIIPAAWMQEKGDCSYNATVAIMVIKYKVLYARRPKGNPERPRHFNVRLSANHLKQMVLAFIGSEEGKNFKPGDRLAVCLLMAQRYGVVSEQDFAAGCLPEAVRYRVATFAKLSAREKQIIPSMLDEADMVLSSFPVTERYRSMLPHDIYRYVAADRTVDPSGKKPPPNDVHCVVLTSHGRAYTQLDEVNSEAELTASEVYYEYLNSYSRGYGVDGCGYVYADSIARTYAVTVVDM